MSDRRDHAEFPEIEDEAIDLALVHADDEYLDMLSNAYLDGREGAPDDFDNLGDIGDDQLTRLLMTWRRDVDAEPIDELVDPKLATATVHAARMQRKRRPRLLVPIAAAAAVLAIAFAGVGLAARDAEPGDTLWALTKVLYADHARSVEAAAAVKADLREAKAALTQGNVAEAKSKLEDAHAALPSVLPDDGRTDLEAQHASLLAQLPGNPSDQAGSPPSPEPSTQPGTDSSQDTAPGTSESNAVTDTVTPSSPPSESPDPPAPTTSTDTSRNEEGGGTPSGGGGTSGETGGTAGTAGAAEGAPAAEGP
jgi:hypothetical protein